MFLIFDTETTGLPKDWKAPITDTDNWPRCIQIAWQLHDDMGQLIEARDYLVKPTGFSIPYQAEKIHGISTELALEQGEELDFVLKEFNEALEKSTFVVGQNVGFDVNVMGCEFIRAELETPMADMPVLDTCTEVTAQLCQIPGGRGGKMKLPTLTELHKHLFGEGFGEAHNATADVEATTRCFLELVRIRVFKAHEMQVDDNYFIAFRNANTGKIDPQGLDHLNLKEESDKIRQRLEAEAGGEDEVDTAGNLELLADVPFSHFHNHTQFSILQSTSEINALVNKAVEFGQPAVGLTDNGNMMAAFQFVAATLKHNKGVNGKVKELEEAEQPDADAIEAQRKKLLKPVLGCDFFVCRDRLDKKVKDRGYSVPMLAKNKKGYHNLAKMASEAYINGFYYVPRIDKDFILQHKEDIIVLTGGLQGEIPGMILNEGIEKAEEEFKWWHEHFGDDFYVELVRHGQEENDQVNKVLLRFAEKYGVKYIAANNSFYIDQEDADSHDILLCVKEGEKKSTPIGRGRGFRFGFPNDEFYFKSSDAMKQLFKDLPDAIINTQEIVDKIEIYDLAREVLLPAFDIPEEFQDAKDLEDPKLKNGENNFLRHLTYEGAKKRYPEMTDEIRERLDFELSVIANTGYPGYFLIVQDFCDAARDMGVSVGPGRGSAAGSAVAYCTGITNVDPIHYDLLFERFLNPDRISLPDIDIDFDDEGRSRVIDWVIDKYGASQVAQIITYGTMAAKSSIRDCGRVLELPLPDTDRIAKLVPDIKLKKLFGMDDVQLAQKLNAEQMVLAKQMKGIYEQQDLEGEVLRKAHALEGSVRNTGIHACGVIITPSDIREIVPVAVAKDSTMWNTQFDNSVVEDAGLLKMDFLGLKTLTLIKDTLKIVKARHDVDIDIEEIPLDDVSTYELFQRGETVGIFQYESPGMQKHMKALKPTVFADLIAMNALYRPGPLEYIPSFIRRKHGEEEIVYDVEDCAEYLEETYGITVYQEQVMRLSQKLANFTKGEADTLRKAMGKKSFDLLAKMKPQFLEQGAGNGHDKKKLEKIWKDWEAFAAYAFNKSHSTCYAWIAYQTAYLKAHYPPEYMAAVLSNNMSDIKQVTFFMEECRRMGLEVLGPDVNESYFKFAVNSDGAVRFGLGAVRGIGEGAVRAITTERKENGNYNSIFDFARRVSLKDCNKRVFESMTLSGAFDRYDDIHRAQYFYKEFDRDSTLMEKAIKYGHAYQASLNSNQVNMFGGENNEVDMPEPVAPRCDEWDNLVKLNKEKEMIGIFISGHPLDDYGLELNNFCNAQVSHLDNLAKYANKDLSIGGIITNASERLTRRGQPFGIFEIEDYSGSKEIFLFSEDYLKFKFMLAPGAFVLMKGKILPRKWGTGELEFKMHSMDLLDKARDKATSITIEMDLNRVNGELIKEMHALASGNEGACKLKFAVYDHEEKIRVNMPSKSMKVKLTQELIDGIEKLDVAYSVG
jgi:DNA polymerase-3 subunit alpha